MSTAVIGAPEFRARSGRTVRSNEDGSVTFEGVRGYLGPEQVFDAEEYFQVREDARRGRWRSPQHPDFVCYDRDGSVFVIDERDGRSVFMQRGYIMPGLPEYSEVAIAYFEAHPEPKPWQQAEHGEAWALRLVGSTVAAAEGVETVWQYNVHSRAFVSQDFGSLRFDDALIADGRRIWPEDAS